jgi:SAM-dependent methyltransferase
MQSILNTGGVMSRLLLDIGAGDSSFVTHFLLLNRGLCSDFICGEPSYQNPWNGVSRWRRVKEARAQYDDFEIAPATLDIVTLNAYHPMYPPHGVVPEVIKCLRPGGLFISAHPIGIHPTVDSIDLVDTFPRGHVAGFCKSPSWITSYEARFTVEGIGTIRYPASPTIRDRIRVLEKPDKYAEGGALTCYMYRNIWTLPTVRVWQKRH